MPILNVREMGTIGVISDIAPWDLPPSALTDGSNFRMSAGKIQSTGGLKLSGFPQDDDHGHITQSTDLDKNSLWIVAGSKKLRTWNGVTAQDIATGLTFPGSGLNNPHKWSSCQIGSQLFFNHPDWHPIVWEDRDEQLEQAQMLPWSPGKLWSASNKSCKVLRAHKNFLWALGMVEDDEVYSDKVWWSHPAEPNGYPYTWEPANSGDRSSLAGYLSMGRGGAVVGGESLRDSFVIYSDEAINVMDFTGDALLWRRRSVSSSAGLVGKEAVVEVNGTHFLISNDDILMFDGNQVSSLMHNKLKKRLAQKINNNARSSSWAAHNPVFNEIWFAVPEGTSAFANTVYVYNYRDGTWAIRDLGQEFRHGHFGNQATKPDDRLWDKFTINWNESRASWLLAGDQPFNGQLNGVEGQRMHNIDPQVPDSPPVSEVMRTDLPIGGHEVNTTITRVYPLIEGSSEVEMRFGSQQLAGGGTRWTPWQTFKPGSDRKIDIRTTGELHSYHVRSKDGGFFNLTGFDIEYSMAGQR